jgi:hypothetical protein
LQDCQLKSTIAGFLSWWSLGPQFSWTLEDRRHTICLKDIWLNDRRTYNRGFLEGINDLVKTDWRYGYLTDGNWVTLHVTKRHYDNMTSYHLMTFGCMKFSSTHYLSRRSLVKRYFAKLHLAKSKLAELHLAK